MKSLNIKAFGGLFFLILVLFTVLFISAGTLNYWQAWTFLVVFALSILAITIYLMKRDPKLLERRVKAGPLSEKEKSQKIIQFVAQFTFILIFIIPALDFRYSWSTLPYYVSFIGDGMVFLGLFIVFLVFKENTFTSAIIEVDQKQKVVATGPYKIVRHPMYSGAMIMLLGTPLALGSWLGLFVVMPIFTVIIVRLLDEEKLLAKSLDGYKNYCHKTQFHLIPYIW